MCISLVLSAALCSAAPQGGDDIAVVRAAERERTGAMARVAPAVCSVMPVDASGGGSGVIIDPAGFMLTNFHVVQRRQQRSPPGEPPPAPPDGDAPPRDGGLPPQRYPDLPSDSDRDDPAWKLMKVGLPDGELYLADVLGIDPGSDLAVMLLRPRADGQPYPFAPLGDSDALLVGEPVFAMGNPFLLATDFAPTVTWGVVSGTHRYQPGGGNRFLVYPDCIQVDAPVNPGNSGGPLFNERGEVVGINGRISVDPDRGRLNSGVGFAIASNQIRNFVGDLLAGRHAEHGTLDLNAWFMSSREQGRRGVFVQATFADSKAAALGVGLGDEIVSFNGVEVRSANQLATLVGVLPAYSWVSLGYRKHREDEGFGPEATICFQLTRLDTGSSRNEARIATEAQRRLAREALTRAVGAGEDRAVVAAVHLQRGDEAIWIYRSGDRLRWDDGRLALVRTEPGRGFAVAAGVSRDLTPEEQAKLERGLTDPLLWSGTDRKALVAESTLEGGVLVFGKPAYRFAVPGDGQREVFLYEDGRAAGCRYRDAVQKKLVDYLYDAAGGRARIVLDGELQDGWSIAVGGEVPEELFTRPER